MLTEVWHRVSGKHIALALVVGVYLDVLRIVEVYGDTSGRYSVAQLTAYTLLAPLLVLFAANAADLRVERGAPPFRTFLSWLLAAAVLACMTRYGTRAVEAACCSVYPIESELRFRVIRAFDDILDILSVGGVFMLTFYNRRTAARALEAVRAAELQRLMLERRVLDSRLEAASAEIDPQALFTSMSIIRDLLITDPVAADRAMDDLIQTLRAKRPAGLQP